MKTVALYHPFAVEKVLNDFNRYVDSVFGESPFGLNRSQSWFPVVDLKETDESYQLEVELPGYDEKTVQVHVDGNMLTIASKKDEDAPPNVPPKTGTKEESVQYIIRERQTVSFSRSFKLPENADTDAILARFKNGLLCLEIKKCQGTQKRTIQIGINKD
ncbi:MAG: Hsp20/alpha crystallin family protein [Treponema sp.]|jgi:HSP20 family protein|nr:Hsp20/alpha crystallin family protein [Treponema sp.]